MAYHLEFDHKEDFLFFLDIFALVKLFGYKEIVCHNNDYQYE